MQLEQLFHAIVRQRHEDNDEDGRFICDRLRELLDAPNHESCIEPEPSDDLEED